MEGKQLELPFEEEENKILSWDEKKIKSEKIMEQIKKDKPAVIKTRTLMDIMGIDVIDCTK